MPDADLIERARSSEDYAKLKELMGDPEWRLDNLYWIKDKDGLEIPFKRNLGQRMYCSQQWFRDNILKGRQLGFSTLIAIMILDECLFVKNTMAGIVDLTIDDAIEKLAKIKYAYSNLPQALRLKVALNRNNDKEMDFSNGSNITVGTSYRGGTLQMLMISEYGKISARKPDVAIEIKTGAIPAVGKNGKIWVESTAEGTSGEFHDMVQQGQRAATSGAQLSQLDFKLHFFPWWLEPGYRLPANSAIISLEMHDYFNMLLVKHGIPLDAEQKAWYVVTRNNLGPDKMYRENPSIQDECFWSSNEGAYFRREMTKARQDGRIGQGVPHDPSRLVNTFWDIGVDDETAIWFHQSDGVRHRLIDYYEVSQEGLLHAVEVLKEKQRVRGFKYGQHWGPHDLEVREWGSGGGATRSRREMAKDLGVTFVVVPRIEVKADSIEAARQFINLCYFDSEHCERGVACLDNYTKQWNKSIAQFVGEPAKNGYQHGADSFQTGARGVKPDKMEKSDRYRPQPRTGSQWGR